MLNALGLLNFFNTLENTKVMTTNERMLKLLRKLKILIKKHTLIDFNLDDQCQPQLKRLFVSQNELEKNQSKFFVSQ